MKKIMKTIEFYYLIEIESNQMKENRCIYNGTSLFELDRISKVVIDDNGYLSDTGLHIEDEDCMGYFMRFKLENYIPHCYSGKYKIICTLTCCVGKYPTVISVEEIK